MLNYSPNIYQLLESEIDSCISLKTHLLIVTLPGLGATHLLQHYLANHPHHDINYINSSDQPISNTYNFLDVQFNQIETYFNQSNYQQKFAVVVNQPHLLQTPDYLNSTLPKRFLKIFYLGAFSELDISIFLKDINPDVSASNIKTIYKLSAGIPRLAKFLLTNIELIHQDIAVIVNNSLIENIILPTVTTIAKTDFATQQMLNIDIANPIIAHFLQNIPQKVNIKINFDLTITENDITSPHSLNKIESLILGYMIDNQGTITREKIAEFKWGQNSFDDFSDLAITKTMRRLRHKLTIYSIKTIPKTGYTII